MGNAVERGNALRRNAGPGTNVEDVVAFANLVEIERNRQQSAILGPTPFVFLHFKQKLLEYAFSLIK